jgi:hypothetical protein
MSTFYHTPLGLLVLRLLRREIRAVFADTRLPMKVVGAPAVLLPKAQPLSADAISTLKEGRIQRLVMLHTLEHVADPILFLQACYEALQAEGVMVLLVPNRLHRWSRSHTPFGDGKPFTRMQIESILQQTPWRIVSMKQALRLPPVALRIFVRAAQLYLSLLSRWSWLNELHQLSTSCLNGGVWVVVLEKRIFAPLLQPILTNAPAQQIC